MELPAPALAVGFGVDRDRHGVLHSPRQDAIDEVLQGIQGLTVASDEKPGAIALDCELDSLRVFLGRRDLAPLAHQLEHLRQDRSRFARLFVEPDRLASRIALVVAAPHSLHCATGGSARRSVRTFDERAGGGHGLRS